MKEYQHMNLQSIIGQLFMVGFPGQTLASDSAIAEDIVARNLGGVILFDRFLAARSKKNNIVSPAQLQSLTSSLQHLAGNTLLIATDQEGGRVCRLKEEYGFPASVTAATIGRSREPGFAERQADLIAATLAAHGINFNFAPVADLNLNPANPIIGGIGRSFSDDPERVTALCAAWLSAHKRHGVLGCLKHFPGHGSSETDSHRGFVDISTCWQERELLPYRELIGKIPVDAVMVGHLFHKRLDGRLPASLSVDIIGGILRRELHFTGVVVSDDLQMRAITDRYGLQEAIILALSAGVDLIVIGNNISYDADIVKKAVRWVEEAVQGGKLSIDTLTAAYTRVQALKDTLIHRQL